MTLDHANEMVLQFLHDGEHSQLVDLADLLDAEPTDGQILDVLADSFDMEPVEMVERLICMDFVSLRREAMHPQGQAPT